ncbi:cytochrome c oxidase assembly protein [Ferrovibrio sp.]|uniref:cytochrome c oxidase assembly protein n=1 Tax=Ferrovibrio sp. TaxID=1917215 RepID=UPI0025BDF3DF|nr:cytochrome c oxidase assembly protein [Ferrovibrio sp.]MBX3456604.1 cytochrome c oxidase assembly protein [Ferrovibrio sp.]
MNAPVNENNTGPQDKASQQDKNRRVVTICVSVVAVMTALSFASAPLYDLFCRVTGFGGTPLRADAAPGTDGRVPQPGKMITVRFNSDISADLPWQFSPAQREVKVMPGEETLIFYRATNPTNHPIIGNATFNVTPEKAGPYFNKIACFCFTEQVLQPGQTVDMPVSFFVDPEMLKDPKTREMRTITLSYTFFRKPGDARVSDSGAANGGQQATQGGARGVN